jgi:hypothetical protein
MPPHINEMIALPARNRSKTAPKKENMLSTCPLPSIIEEARSASIFFQWLFCPAATLPRAILMSDTRQLTFACFGARITRKQRIRNE